MSRFVLDDPAGIIVEKGDEESPLKDEFKKPKVGPSPFVGRKALVQGTCEPGQRADLTGCTPASRTSGAKRPKKQDARRTGDSETRISSTSSHGRIGEGRKKPVPPKIPPRVSKPQGMSFETHKVLASNLKMVADLTQGNRPDWKHSSFESMVLEDGRRYPVGKIPKGVKHGEQGQCYMNAFNLATRNPKEYTYVEGYALISKEIPLPIAHAWVVNKSGEVVDNTWKTPGAAYLGIPFSDKFIVQHALKTRVYGILGHRSVEYLKNGLPKNSGDITTADEGSGEPVQTPPFSTGTMGKYLRKDGTWAPERLPIHGKVFKSFREKVTNQETKGVLYMTGGGFGSGKSTLLDMFPEHVGFPTKDKAAVADPDAAKQFLPEMAERVELYDKGAASYVHEESSLLAKQAVSEELTKGNSVIYDTSGDSDPNKLHGKTQGYRKEGATKVVSHYATPLSFDEAMRRVKAREAKAKGVRRELSRVQVETNHREVTRCWLASAKNKTFDELGLWSTAGEFGSPPKKIAEAKDGETTILDEEAFKMFVKMGE